MKGRPFLLPLSTLALAQLGSKAAAQLTSPPTSQKIGPFSPASRLRMKVAVRLVQLC
jgi:hypothetical protein